jgi:predicted nucleic acid-binding protein
LIVIDASALLELLLGTDRADDVAARVLAPEEHVHAPHLLDMEIAQALRRLVQLADIGTARAQQALDDCAALVIHRHAHYDLVPRIWELRDSVTAYDGAYIALAEALDAPLVTCDSKLARSHGHSAKIDVVAA